MNQIRYTDGNWARFKTHNKKTTTRSGRRPDGVYERVKGSLFNPIKTGEKIRLAFKCIKYLGTLTEEDAILDGFDTLEEFKDELFKLNPTLDPSKPLFIHWNEVI